MNLNKSWTQITVASNLRFHRDELDLTQKEVAKLTGVSYRLIQEIESGTGNPTLETLFKIAFAFKISVKDLLSLSYLRIAKGDTEFLDRYKASFKSERTAVGLRNLEGVILWGNKSAEKINGGISFQNGPVDMIESLSGDGAGLLRNQMAAEKNGFAYPYTMARKNPKTGEIIFLRCHPTLILASKGRSPAFISVYLSSILEDCEANYFEYCSRLMSVIYSK